MKNTVYLRSKIPSNDQREKPGHKLVAVKKHLTHHNKSDWKLLLTVIIQLVPIG